MSYASEVLADSPVLYLRLGEASGNFADSSGNGHTAVVSGTVTHDVTNSALTNGNDDGAVTFPTSSDYLTVTDHADLDLGNGPFSIEFWCKRITDTGALEGILAKGTNGYAVLIDPNDKITLTKDQVISLSIGSTNITTGTWRHVVVTKDGTGTGKHTIYIDGTADTLSYDNTTATLSDTSIDLTIGKVPSGGDPPFLGSVDEVAFYKSVLSSTRIAAHYAARSAATTPTWTAPANSASMSTTPELKFTSPVSASKQHFYLQLDTAATFDTGNLRTYDSSADQTNWTYYDGDSWEAMPADGLPIAMSGNEVKYTVTSALTATTWYRRVRAGT